MARRPKYRRGIKPGRICEWPTEAGPPEVVAAKATYAGHTIHKSHPSPAGAPAWRADKSKCDRFDASDWPKLQSLLRDAITKGCIGEFRDGFPSRAWGWINNVLHEARLTGQGEYHGFPIDDPRQYPEPLERLELAPRVSIPQH